MRGELKKKVTKARGIVVNSLLSTVRKELAKAKPYVAKRGMREAPVGQEYDQLVKTIAFEAIRFVKQNKLAPQNKLVRLAKRYEAQYR